ncbi:MAG: fused MFS/spermidine synthase [Candidatus Bathyarchaeia archaeon]|nr:fused MFS/spermidine synthase [Candidatus Bathyarchaeota archaeon]
MGLSGRLAPWVLRVQVFASGAVVMALELVGSRILAVDFGSSIFVWGGLIGVILTALSLGYSYGGRLADRILSYTVLSSIIFSSGLLILFIPHISPLAVDLALRLGLGERYGPIMVTALLMGLPTFLLGMVSPYAIKLAAGSLTGLGRVAGNLYAISTLGSIAGTFGTVFILIPIMDVRSIISLLGVVLLASSAVSLGRGPRILLILVLLVLYSPVNSILMGAQVIYGSRVFEKETPYSHLEVVDSGGVRTLYLNGLPHSAMYLNGSRELVFPYTRYFALGFLFKEDAGRVLFVGGGGFSGPKRFLQDYEEVEVDVVEIDPDVIEVARRYFDLKDDPRLTVYNEDGRRYLQRIEKRYDLVVLDAYSKTYVPFHLMTHEFFKLLHERLSDDGVIISNLIASLVGDTANLFWAEYRTISQVFPSIYIFPTSDTGPGWVQNIILVASKNPNNLTEEMLKERAHMSGKVDQKEATELLSRLWKGPLRAEEAPILLDNFAPVEALLNPITGKPYALESEYEMSRPSIKWVESSNMAIALLAAILISWLFLLPQSIIKAQ